VAVNIATKRIEYRETLLWNAKRRGGTSATKRMAVQHLGAKVLVINLGAKAPTTSYNFRTRKMGMRPRYFA
jgi:hypothetical protein